MVRLWDFFRKRDKEDAAASGSVSKHLEFMKRARYADKPEKKAKVVLWVNADEEMPGHWHRINLTHTKVTEWEKHEPHERTFCERRNEWNLCKAMGEGLYTPETRFISDKSMGSYDIAEMTDWLRPYRRHKLYKSSVAEVPSSDTEDHSDARAPLLPPQPELSELNENLAPPLVLHPNSHQQTEAISPPPSPPPQQQTCRSLSASVNGEKATLSGDGIGNKGVSAAGSVTATDLRLESFREPPAVAFVRSPDAASSDSLLPEAAQDKVLLSLNTSEERRVFAPLDDDGDAMGPYDLICNRMDEPSLHHDAPDVDMLDYSAAEPHQGTMVADCSSGDSAVPDVRRLLEAPMFDPFLDYMFYRYGFIYPPKGPEYQDDATWKGALSDSDLRAMRSDLLDAETPLFHSDDVHRDFYHFFLALSSTEDPSASLWDLSTSNGSQLVRSDVPVRVEVVKSIVEDQVLYRLQAGQKQEDWLLYVEDASVAVECLRRRFTSTRDIVTHFLFKGTPFVRAFQASPPSNLTLEPRLINSKPLNPSSPSKAFAAWEKEARDFMQSPRSRLVWCSGGILWRLALYLVGPVEVESLLNLLDSSPDPCTRDVTLAEYEEVLRKDEVDILIGRSQRPSCKSYVNIGRLHYSEVQLGQINQKETTDESFWPGEGALRLSYFSNISCWTPAHEKWFTKRVESLREGVAGPLTQNEWRKSLRNKRVAFRATLHVRDLSKRFLATPRADHDVQNI